MGETEDKAERRVEKLLEDDWQQFLDENPLQASELGVVDHDHRWPDLSPEAFQDRLGRWRGVIDQVDKLLAEPGFSAEDRLNLQLLRRKYTDAAAEQELGWHLVPLSAREGIQDASFVADGIVFDDADPYERWIARLESFPAYMDQTLARMREGARTGMVQAEVVMRRVPRQIERQIVEAEQSPFFSPFRRFPDSIPVPDQARLAEAGRRAIADRVVPTYSRMLEFFTQEYLPACSQDVGAWQLPAGDQIYAHFARSQTTANLTPQEIHDLGLEEVERIREQMQSVIDRVGHAGTFESFLERLRTDPSQYYASAEELRAGYEALCSKIDSALPRLFDRLPKVWYDIQPIPDNLAPDTTTAYYRPLSADGRRAGTYFVNLYRPGVRPKYEMEALSLHEAVPGHHLQIALATELPLPSFRRYAPEGEYTGYVEGWALYAESLGGELGCYTDPYSEFGRLTYEMWRAVRLVVDTGIHAFRWSREQAIEYFAANTAKVRHDIENEVDRYIAWPGQALAYKVGEVEVQRLRRTAEAELAERFDVKEFHSVLLGEGAVPLDLLREIVRRWIDDRTGPG